MPADPSPFFCTGAPEVNYNRLGMLKGVRFKDSRNGVIVGDNGVILLTHDGEEEALTFTRIDLFGDMPRPWPNMNYIDMDNLGMVSASLLRLFDVLPRLAPPTRLCTPVGRLVD